MIERKCGHIINLGSVAGDDVYEKGNIYCASKATVDAISRSMRIDLLQHHIKVTNIKPGVVETEFGIVRYKGDSDKAHKVYQGFTPLTGRDIADAIFYCASLPPNICINELEITCIAQATGFFSTAILKYGNKFWYNSLVTRNIWEKKMYPCFLEKK